MTDTLLALLCIALAIVGVCGVVVPVLPGSASVLAALLVWAWFGPSSWGWVAFGVGAVLLVIGFASQYVLTGKRLKERQIPQRSVVIGLVCGVVGLFVIPFLGLPIGFIAATALLCFVAALAFHARPLPAAVSAVATAVVFFVLLDKMLDLPLPRGPLGI